MSQALTAEGTFRGRIIEYGVQESSDTASQSMGVYRSAMKAAKRRTEAKMRRILQWYGAGRSLARIWGTGEAFLILR